MAFKHRKPKQDIKRKTKNKIKNKFKKNKELN